MKRFPGLSNPAVRAGFLLIALCLCAPGCAGPLGEPGDRPSVAPTTQPGVSLSLDPSKVSPMYRDLLPVDLPTVLRVAGARNLDIRQARQRVEANRGRYEASVENVFPVVAPGVAYQHYQGTFQNANGTLTPHVHFDNLLPAVSVQWVLNPAAVIYDIVAARRRLEASGHQERSVVLEAQRSAAVQYYDLVLAQAKLAVAEQAVREADELLRITELKVKAGTGLEADELRARAALAGFQQDVVLALNNFYQASVALTLTLHLDATITLVPGPRQIDQTTLVRQDIPIDELLTIAARHRPDLEAVRALLRATEADTGQSVWGGLGPALQAGFTEGGIQTYLPGKDYGLSGQQRASVGVNAALGLSTFGRVKTAAANERSAGIDVERQSDRVRAAVVSAQQDSAANAQIIPVARRQLEAAQAALDLAQTNLRAGTMLTIDVLQAEDAADQARLRYVNAVVHYNQSQVNLLAALGLLDPQTLLAPTEGPSSQAAATQRTSGPRTE